MNVLMILRWWNLMLLLLGLVLNVFFIDCGYFFIVFNNSWLKIITKFFIHIEIIILIIKLNNERFN